MRYLVLATDYDGTIATDGQAEAGTLRAIERLRMSGRRAILLTGRRLDDLVAIFPRIGLFDYVVAENGAVAYEPRTREQTLLAKAPPPEFIQRWKELTGNSIEVGRWLWAPGYLIRRAAPGKTRELMLSFIEGRYTLSE
jgi:hydroxymethylpyrimidine pyrophosphatase-like HAD family hydrolase